MNKIFTVVAFGGEYDDAWEETEVATLDESKARAYIEEQIKLNEAHVQLHGKFQARLDQLMALRETSHPYPVERGELTDDGYAAIAEYHQKRDEWYEVALQQVAAEQGITVEAFHATPWRSMYGETISYRIVSIPLL